MRSITLNGKRPSLLEGDLGRAIHEEILGAYSKFPVVTSGVEYDGNKGIVVGAQPFYNVAVQNTNLAREREITLPTLLEIEKIRTAKALQLNGKYIDAGIGILNDRPWKESLEGLAKQLESKLPSVVWLKDLTLEKDEEKGIIQFKLHDAAQSITAPILKKEGLVKFRLEDEGCSIIESERGGRNLFIAEASSLRIFINRCSCVYAQTFSQFSDKSGRVVILS